MTAIERAKPSMPRRMAFARCMGTVAYTALLAVGAGSVHAQALSVGPVPTTKRAGQTTSKVEEVTVTANKFGRNLEKAAVAVTAIDSATLKRDHVQTIEDIQVRVPSLTYDSPSSFATAYIRGLGSNFSLAGLESPVATYVDGVYLQRQDGAVVNLVDVHNVEVLKGPQGTLYGRNATGGVLLVDTNDPTNKFGGSITTEFGRFDNGKAQAVLNVPITPTLAIRLVGQVDTMGNYINNSNQGAFGSSKNFGDSQGQYFRGKIRWKPLDNLTIVYGFEYNNYRTTANAQQEILPAPYCTVCTVFGIPPMRDGFFSSSSSAGEYQRTNSDTHTLHVDYDTSAFSLSSVTGYRHQASGFENDQDFVAPPLLAAQINETGPTFTEDTYVRSKLAGPLNFLVGFGYERERDQQDSQFLGEALGPFSGATSIARIAIDSFSVYGEATYHFTKEISLTAGARFNRDSKTVDVANDASAQVAFGGPPGFHLHASFKDVTPRVVLADDSRFGYFYVSYNRGAKSGGFASPTFVPEAPVSSETLDSFEIGAKNKFLDGRLSTDFDMFYGHYKNIQVQIINSVSGTVNLQNAGSANLYGIEGDARYTVSDGFRVSAGFTFLHNRFASFPDAAGYAYDGGVGLSSVLQNLKGTPLPRSPDLTLFAAPDYNFPVFGWAADAAVSARFSTAYYFEAGAGGPLRLDSQGAYVKVGASFTVTSPDGSTDIGVFGDNITNTHYKEYATTTAFGATYLPPLPATYGVRLTYRF